MTHPSGKAIIPAVTTLHVIRGDITTLAVDAIVNSANNDLILGAGVSGAIRRVGGAEIQEACNSIGTIPLGTVGVTPSGALASRHILHAAVLPLGLWADDKSVRNAMKECFRIAVEKGMKSIAIPAVGAGAGAFPIDRCADVLLSVTRRHLEGETSLEAILFVMYDEKLHETFLEHFKRIFPDLDPEAPLPSPLPLAEEEQKEESFCDNL